MPTFMFLCGLLLCLLAVVLVAFGHLFYCDAAAILAVPLMVSGYGRAVQAERVKN